MRKPPIAKHNNHGIWGMRLDMDVAKVKEAIGEVCATCGLPQKGHFRGANGNRFVGCEGARVAKMLQAAADGSKGTQ